MGSGQVIRTGTRTVKGVVGYDLTRLLVGSEGTLGVIVEATLKLVPRPLAKATLAGVFNDLEAAALAVNSLLRAGCWPSALEFLDRTVLRAVKEKLPFRPGPGEGALILVELDGSQLAVKEESAQAARVLAGQGGRVIRAGSDRETEALWAARRSVSESLKELKPRKVSEDVAVPRSRLPEAVQRLEELGRETGLLVAAYGHAGDGNIHVNILFEPGEESKVEQAVGRVFRIALDLGGTLSGEHGVGLTKAAYLGWELGSSEIELMKGLKNLFDPRGILNPGKIFPPA
jgi:glycolate oxidase